MRLLSMASSLIFCLCLSYIVGDLTNYIVLVLLWIVDSIISNMWLLEKIKKDKA